ncbi:hypothetical protein D3C84_1038800 [compost metagenome]
MREAIRLNTKGVQAPYSLGLVCRWRVLPSGKPLAGKGFSQLWAGCYQVIGGGERAPGLYALWIIWKAKADQLDNGPIGQSHTDHGLRGLQQYISVDIYKC